MHLTPLQTLRLIAGLLLHPISSYMLLRGNHICIQLDTTTFPPVVTLETSEERNVRIDLELAELRNRTDPQDFILAALRAAKGSSFIIFQASSAEFLQFWIRHGDCICSYPLAKENTHRQRLKRFLKLVDELRFTKLPQRKDSDPAPEHYMVKRLGPVTDYSINFGRVSPRVGAFAKRVFLEVFEDDLENIQASVG
jgi:hypothetical protein